MKRLLFLAFVVSVAIYCGSPTEPTPDLGVQCDPRLPLPVIGKGSLEVSRHRDGRSTTVVYLRPDDMLTITYVDGKVCEWDTSDN